MLDGWHKYFHTNDFICSSRQAHGLADEDDQECGHSVSDFLFSKQARITCCHSEALFLAAPLPGKDFLQTSASSPSPPSRPCLRVTASQRTSSMTPSKRSHTHTPLLLFLTLLSFSSKFLAHVTYWYNFSVSFYNSTGSQRSGIFVSLSSVIILTSGILPGK